MEDDIALRVEKVSKTFKLPHEKNSSIKSAVINFYKRDKGFERQQALNDISFDVKKGEFFAVIGRNGSGKSTLLKTLAGIYSPDEGNIAINGKLIPFIELGVGFSPELSGRDNVFLNGSLLGFSRKEMKAMYDDIVNFAEIERFMDQKLKNYSSGMHVRLAFSIATRAKSDILLLDEVLAVGDSAFQQKCFDYFDELRQQGKTVILVSHDMAVIKRFCTKAIYIKNGKIIHRGTPAEMADIYLEENINKAIAPSSQVNTTDSKHRLSQKIVSREDYRQLLSFNYESKDKEEMYIGVSLIKDGISIAEINSLPAHTLKGSGKLSFSLDTSFLNSGTYYTTCALFKKKNRELVCLGENRCDFLIKSDDVSNRSGALKLQDTWEKG